MAGRGIGDVRGPDDILSPIDVADLRTLAHLSNSRIQKAKEEDRYQKEKERLQAALRRARLGRRKARVINAP
jgi:hypothetical protein